MHPFIPRSLAFYSCSYHNLQGGALIVSMWGPLLITTLLLYYRQYLPVTLLDEEGVPRSQHLARSVGALDLPWLQA